MDITINGLSYPVKFGLFALRKLAAYKNLSKFSQIQNLLEELTLDDMPQLVYLCMQNANLIHKIDLPTYEDVVDACDLDFKIVTTTMAAMGQDMAMAPSDNGAAVDEGEPVEAKN